MWPCDKLEVGEMRKSCAYFYCKLDNGMDFTSAFTLGTDGKYYLRKRGIKNEKI